MGEVEVDLLLEECVIGADESRCGFDPEEEVLVE